MHCDADISRCPLKFSAKNMCKPFLYWYVDRWLALLMLTFSLPSQPKVHSTAVLVSLYRWQAVVTLAVISVVMELKFSCEFHLVKVIVSVYRHVTWETMKCILCGQSTPVIIGVASYQQNSVMYWLLSTPCQTSCIASRYRESLRYVVFYFVSSLSLVEI